MATQASIDAVNSAYQSLFGRAPDPAGLGYADMLDNGQISATNLRNTIAQGAQGADQAYLQRNTQVVAGVPQGPNQINVADYGASLITNPSLGLARDDPTTPDVNESMFLGDHVTPLTDAQIAAGTIQNTPQIGASTYAPTTVDKVETVANVAPKDAVGYTPEGTLDEVSKDENQVKAAQGTINQNDLVDPNAVGNGELSQETKDAMKPITQNISNIIDTSTIAGKILADQLGEGNYLDSKATLKGQLDILQAEFSDANGNPTIPSWASGVARNVSKIASFQGMTGTAATAALAQAIMEASLPVAQQEATFFQTVTLKNLDNRQQSAINNAQILAKLDMQNMDARTQAAIVNAQSFLQMDMTNLNNEQQARIINTQSRIQSILSDANAVNVAKQFGAQSQNEMTMFYDNLNSQINQFNASQKNGMAQFNANAKNTAAQFNAAQTQAAAQFNASMQFAVDSANTQWRQTVTMTQNAQEFEAAATDVKNLVGISTEELNNTWQRADQLLDYVWKSAESDADRKNQLAMITLKGQIEDAADNNTGVGNFIGQLLGIGGDLLMGAFGF